MSMTAEIAAAEWWADAIGAPRFDNGDTSAVGGMASMMATILADRTAPPDDSTRGKFVAALAPKLGVMIDRGFAPCVGVDYGPDKELADAAREAGISTSRFPWKTNMWVHSDHVTVSAGYGAAARLVWASDEWLASRPLCGQQKYDDEKYRADREYHGEPWACSLPVYHDEGHHEYGTPLTLCGVCGRPDGWYHSVDERGHMPDFHKFAVRATTA